MTNKERVLSILETKLRNIENGLHSQKNNLKSYTEMNNIHYINTYTDKISKSLIEKELIKTLILELGLSKDNVSFSEFVDDIESKNSCFDIKKIHQTDDGTPVVIELKDKDEELTISTKWDGCIDLNYNDDYIHICNVEDFISKLQEVIKISEEHFENWS